MQKRLEFPVAHETLVGDLHLPESVTGKVPCVITSHGYKANRQSQKYLQLAAQLNAVGIAVLRFDHRGALNGESSGKFEDMTLSGRITDVQAAIETLSKEKEVDAARLGMLGSSLGGMDVLLINDAGVKAKVVISTPFKFPPLSDAAKSSFSEKGYFDYADGTRIKKEFYADLAQHDLPAEIKKIDCPLLVLHGSADELVPRHHTKVIYDAAGSKVKEIKIINGADHAFTGPTYLAEALGLAIDWFKKYLLV